MRQPCDLLRFFNCPPEPGADVRFVSGAPIEDNPGNAEKQCFRDFFIAKNDSYMYRVKPCKKDKKDVNVPKNVPKKYPKKRGQRGTLQYYKKQSKKYKDLICCCLIGFSKWLFLVKLIKPQYMP